MIKKIVCLFAIAALALTVSCKKVEKQLKEPLPPMDVTLGRPPSEVQAPPPADGKYPVMEFSRNEHDFGVIDQGDKVTYTFNFKNTGEADLLILAARGSCGCTIPEYSKDPVKPGDSGKIKVLFNSAGKSGHQMKSVNITTNTAAGKEKLIIRASITPNEDKKHMSAK
jgi:hypothetical protein